MLKIQSFKLEEISKMKSNQINRVEKMRFVLPKLKRKFKKTKNWKISNV